MVDRPKDRLMTEIVVLCIAALITSLLTFFSGFGVGTILTPVFAIFFPVDLAIALTGVVHLLNNIFKLFLIGGKADTHVVLRFGIPAFFAALVGAYVLLQVSELKPIATYFLWGNEYFITPVKLTIAILLISFVLMEGVPSFRKLQFGKGKLVLGGLLSGFFGGLSGNQGALRSAFLIKSDLSKEALIATGVVIACIVDFSRLGVYLTRFARSGLQENLSLVIAATVSAFIGAYAGRALLKVVTLKAVQITVTTMLVILSVALGFGIV
jgi:uncharacterized membrane protein YfcA